jgi:hypothetical protein
MDGCQFEEGGIRLQGVWRLRGNRPLQILRGFIKAAHGMMDHSDVGERNRLPGPIADLATKFQ